MIRQASKMLSTGAHLIANDSGDDERESWLCPSTTSTDTKEKDNDKGVCTWSQLHTPIPCKKNNVENSSDNACKQLRDGLLSPNGKERSGKNKLPLLTGFSNAEALKVQLSRSVSDKWQLACGGSTAKENCKIDARVERIAGNGLSQPGYKVEGQRKNWILGRKSEDVKEKVIISEETTAALKRKHYRLCDFNPVAFTANDVEANQRTCRLKRQLQDLAVSEVSVDSTGGTDWDDVLKRRVYSSKHIAKSMPSETNVEMMQDQWTLEKRRTNVHRINTNSDVAPGNTQSCDTAHKLPALTPFSITIPSIVYHDEMEANQRKWNLERRLHDASHSPMNHQRKDGHKQNFEKTFAMNHIAHSIDVEAMGRQNRTMDWRLQNRELHVTKSFEQQYCSTHKLPTLKLVIPGTEASRPTWEAGTKLYRVDDHDTKGPPSGLICQQVGNDEVRQKFRSEYETGFNVANCGKVNKVEIGHSLVYCLLFFSTAVVHSAIFNFSLELRQWLLLDSQPFGIVLLLSRIFVGSFQFVGGLLGDLVQNRERFLRCIAVLWFLAVVMLHVAAFQLPSFVSSVSLIAGFVFAGAAHGIICPNVVALGVESKLYCCLVLTPPIFRVEEDGSSEEEEMEKDTTLECGDMQQQNDFDSHKFFTGCFCARIAGSAFVQGYFYLLVNTSALSHKNLDSAATSRGFHCMLLMSFGLMTSLLSFCYRSWGFHGFEKQRIESNLATTKQDLNSSIPSTSIWSFARLVWLRNRPLVKSALLVLVCVISAGFSMVVMLIRSQTSLSVRLVAFLLCVVGWLLTLVVSSQQITSMVKNFRGSRWGLRECQLYMARLAVAYFCVACCVAFLRAQLYTTMVVQVCQTRLLIPGTTNTLLNPELLGAAVETSSLAFLGLLQALLKSPSGSTSLHSDSKSSLFALPTLAIPVDPPIATQYHKLSSFLTCPSATRMCFATLLYLVSVFLSSVVELYRRQTAVRPSVVPRTCGLMHSEFTFLWTLPYAVLMGASDAVFRVSFQQKCHQIARDAVASSTSSPLSYCWTGTVHGAISLAETLGDIVALSLVAVLSKWLFQPEPTDLALFFLLLTTIVALTHAMLNRITARAQPH